MQSRHSIINSRSIQVQGRRLRENFLEQHHIVVSNYLSHTMEVRNKVTHSVSLPNDGCQVPE